MDDDLSDFDFSDFWEQSDYAREKYVDETPKPELISEVEEKLGYKLPKGYIQLAQSQNGGIPKNTNHRMSEPTSWSNDHIAITGIYSISNQKHYALCGKWCSSQFWETEWGYPAIGIYFADCPSAGHDMIALDYRECGPNGEPKVVHVDQESNYKITLIAENFAQFVRGLESDDTFQVQAFQVQE